MNNLTLREYQTSDAPYFDDIIRKTWEYDLFCSPYIAKKISKLYLLGCLSQQTFTQVAVLDNKPVGIIMCRNKQLHTTSLMTKLRQKQAALSLSCSKEGRAIGRVFASIDRVDEELLGSQSKHYDGELVFFAVDEESRGTGIGKALFQKALEYMKTQKIDDFYLYTDSSCNYAFYERQGMERVAEKTYAVPMKIKNKMKFYLYDYTRADDAPPHR